MRVAKLVQRQRLRQGTVRRVDDLARRVLGDFQAFVMVHCNNIPVIPAGVRMLAAQRGVF